MVMGDPMTQQKLLTTNVLYLGPTSMMFMNKKSRQVVAKIGQIVFSMFAHCHGPPHESFSFFLAMMCWMEGSGSDFKQKVRHYFIFFHYFLTFFAFFFHFFDFWPILHKLRLPMVDPSSPMTPFRTFTSPESNWTALQTEKKSMNLGFFFLFEK